MYIYISMHTHKSMYTLHTRVYIHVHTSVYIHILFPEVLLACIYVFVYIHTHTYTHRHPFFLIFQFNKNEADQHKGNSFIFLKAFHSCSCTAWVWQQALQACPNAKVPHPSYCNCLVVELAINKRLQINRNKYLTPSLIQF